MSHYAEQFEHSERERILDKAVRDTQTLPKLTVARQLHRDYPEHFGTIAAARTAILYRTGSSGANRRNRPGVKEIRLSTIEEGLAKLQGYQRVREEVIHLTNCRALILSDIHSPYYDFTALKIALEYGLERGINVVILNGDTIDCGPISKFPKDSSRPTFPQEIAITIGLLGLIRDTYPDARKILKYGNHELRLRTFLQTHAKELEGIVELADLLHLEEMGYEVVRQERIALGKLNVLHGHELSHGITAPVNPARGVFLKAKKSAIVGHHHQTSHHSEGDIEGGRTGCWSTGCLCDLSPDYNYFGGLKWNHGFAIVDVDEDGLFTVFNHSIIDGKVH